MVDQMHQLRSARTGVKLSGVAICIGARRFGQLAEHEYNRTLRPMIPRPRRRRRLRGRHLRRVGLGPRIDKFVRTRWAPPRPIVTGIFAVEP